MLTLALIIFIIGCCMSSYEDNAYRAEKREEQRHKELMRILSENRNADSLSPQRKKLVRRRIARDKEGNILGEEITEEEINE